MTTECKAFFSNLYSYNSVFATFSCFDHAVTVTVPCRDCTVRVFVPRACLCPPRMSVSPECVLVPRACSCPLTRFRVRDKVPQSVLIFAFPQL